MREEFKYFLLNGKEISIVNQRSNLSSISKADLRRLYDSFSRWYDLAESIPELLFFSSLRRDLLRQAKGKVLEVAAGTGRNLPYYPRECAITAVDLSQAMLQRAGTRAATLGMAVDFRVMDGENLKFKKGSFDTVVSTLTLCTFPDPKRALKEMSRVLKPGGRILLVEHGRSSLGWLSRWQDRHAPGHYARLGCRWNQKPLDIIRSAGLKVGYSQARFFDVFHAVVAKP